jgi:hypothetical protein
MGGRPSFSIHELHVRRRAVKLTGSFCHRVLLRRDWHSRIVDNDRDRGVHEQACDLLPNQENRRRREDLP